ALYLSAAIAALRMAPGLLGPDPSALQPRLRAALLSTVRGLVAGVRHLLERRDPTVALAGMTAMRFCYGALTVMVLMLCRYAWAKTESEGLALLGFAVAISGAGFFVAAVVTPGAVARLSPASDSDGRLRWMVVCAAAATVLV
ncbi:MFS transporter, partial [Streptomyces sp. MCAF7]